MGALKRFGCGFFACAFAIALQPVRSRAKEHVAPVQSLSDSVGADHDGHDFDFNLGTWKTHMVYFQNSDGGSVPVAQLDGTVAVRKVLDGRGQLEELVADNAKGHFESLLIRSYNPATHRWSFNFATSNGGAMCQTMTGGFDNGRGEFYDREPLNGKTILARTTWSDITPDSHRYEESFSEDGGQTWQRIFVATLTREKP
jgi:hypothetical protein